MKIAIVGCGFVFDIYMRTYRAHPELTITGLFDIDSARARRVAAHYALELYPSYESLLADPEVELILNLTSIAAHYTVIRMALEAGKHVYSEKPLTTDLAQSRALFELARDKGLILSGAPCNLFSDAVRTIWKAVLDGAIGKPRLVYAELDDNPVHLMGLEGVRSPTGAPWPLVEELEQGCTFEHLGYHLAWICALFGPARSVTAFSKLLVERRTALPLDPNDTPDYSVACLEFDNGVTARITCSFVAPRDHRMRVIGEEGEITADSYRHYQSPVFLERFSKASLTARKAYSLRTSRVLGRAFGIGGRRLALHRGWKSHAVEMAGSGKLSAKTRLVAWIRRRETYAQDKFIGLAEMNRALQAGSPQPLPADFLLHLNELTLLVQRAGPQGIALQPQTTFVPLEPPADLLAGGHDYRTRYRPHRLEQLAERLMR
ncbi:Gfo/Idh/MocA family oxidoreductase [Novosphingobium sp. YJ-S2-02]|uniref:Gfo/Idh/MocA family oxidoreductase n=1 Tax=Novosphingobium aureum TaxID=2792964 RepID=A0A931HDB7_9SPHN|nr:Gfo/Idh/MocA family oxidoreductase [Novosphingobium aureum]MBH0113975.1 Gfo/Idh/MocA family oxidoreductase [Novosphingobium aureum]